VMCTVIRDLNPSKYDIHLVLITKPGDLFKTVENRLTTHVLNSKHTRNSFLKFLRVLFEIKPNIIYTSTARTSVLAILACMLYRRCTCIARFPTMPERTQTKKHMLNWRGKVLYALYRKADYIIAQTNEMAEQLHSILRVDKKRIVTIQNPIDRRTIQDSILNQPNPMDAGKINVVAAGTIYPVKGFDILIRAFRFVVDQNKDYMLHILGRDRDGTKHKLTELAQTLGISEHVHFHGSVENPYVYFNHCDLFVLSSRIEGMPNALLECLHLGKPVVATKCTIAVQSLIDSGENGFIVDVEDADSMAYAILHYSDLKCMPCYTPENGIVKLIDMVSFSDKKKSLP